MQVQALRLSSASKVLLFTNMGGAQQEQKPTDLKSPGQAPMAVACGSLAALQAWHLPVPQAQ